MTKVYSTTCNKYFNMLNLLYIITAPTPHPWPQTNVLPAPLILQTSQWAAAITSWSIRPPCVHATRWCTHCSGSDTLSRAVPPLPPIITSCSSLPKFLVWIIQEGRKFITFFWYLICSLWYKSYYHLLEIRTCRDYMFAQSHKAPWPVGTQAKLRMVWHELHCLLH